jgi:hypothetical protein
VSLRALAVDFGKTPVGLFMRDSTWAFATVETVHLIGLAALGGAAILLGTAASGVAMRRQPLAETAAGLLPIFVSALAAMVVSGVLLFASKPLRYYLSDPFRLKLVFLAAGVALYLVLDRRLRRCGGLSPAIRAGGVLLLALWLGVGLAGRFIGLF